MNWNSFQTAGNFYVSRKGNYMIVGNLDNGGVNYSFDSGSSWQQPSLPVLQSGAWSVSIDGSNMIAGSQYNDGVFYFLDGGLDWEQPIQPALQSGVWVVSISGNNMIAGSASFVPIGIYYSLGGSSWQQPSPPVLQSGAWSVSIDGSNMIAGSQYIDGVYYSLDGGLNWHQPTEPALQSAAWFVSISGNNMIAGSFDVNGVYYSLDGGSSWQQPPSELILQSGTWLVSISGNNMVAGSNYPETNGVYYSLNGGSTWQQPDETILQSSLWSVSISGTNIIAGSLFNQGVYYTIQQQPICLLSNTKLLTADNFIYKRVHELTLHDKIISPISKTAQKIKSIKKNPVDLSNVCKDNHPLVIKKNSIQKNLPFEDVFVSGYHRIILHKDNENLVGIQAFKLFNTFLTEEEIDKCKEDGVLFYYHIELEDEQEHLIASGLAVESYQKM